MSKWLYGDKEFTDPETYYGFIYIIENLVNGRKYIGRKFFSKASTKQKNKKIKKVRIPSDWEEYWGSCEELLADVEKYGKENFKREILYLCKTLGECKYKEMVEQVDHRVLESRLENGEFAYYNSNVMMKFTRRNIGKF